MDKMLITYGTRPLAQRLQKIMGQGHTFATFEDVPSILLDRYHKIPHATNPVFAHEVLKLCLDHDIHFVLPLHPAECAALADTRVLFDEYGIHILTPNNVQETTSVHNPPSHYSLELFYQGKSLWSDTELPNEYNGLYALVDGEWLLVTL